MVLKKIIIAIIYCFLLSTSAYSQPFTESFTEKYYSVDEINNYLYKVADVDNDIQRDSFGYSENSYEINFLIFGNAKKKIYINGTHHGDEVTSTNAVLSLIQYIHLNKDSDLLLQTFLKNYSIIIQPLVNPDGYEEVTRNNANDHNINRDYDLSDDNKTKEAKVVTDLLRHYEPEVALSFQANNSNYKKILWPYGFTNDLPKHVENFKQICAKLANVIQDSICGQSYDDYPTSGEFIDYAYTKYKTLAFTVEISNEKIARSQTKLEEIQDEAIATFRALMEELSK